MKDDLKKKDGREEKNGRRPQQKLKMDDDLKINKNLFSIPLKFRGKPFLGLAQLSRIFYILKLKISNI